MIIKLRNKTHDTQHIETSNGDVFIHPAEEIEIERDIIFKSEFGRIDKLFELKIVKQKPKQKKEESFGSKSEQSFEKKKEIKGGF